MKFILPIVFLLSICHFSFSQSIESKKSNFIFYSECSNQIVSPKYELTSIPESENIKILTYYIERGEWIGQNTVTVDLKKNDTIRIPKILFGGGKELHSKNWTYLNCNQTCHGTETDFYPNGNKRLEGSFINGKPTEIKFYRNNGIIESQEIYEPGTLNVAQMKYFDEKGLLMGYEFHRNLRKRTIIKTFDKNNKLIKKEIRYYL